MRPLHRAAGAGAALLLLGGHYACWYAPRERPGQPDPDGLAGRLLASSSYEACLWLPYPHQNLGALEGAVDDWPRYLAAAARIANVAEPAVPSFGPFAVPPARELVLCSDLHGRRLVLAARVYPAIAAIARMAGRVADNPWLRGGAVEVSHGPARVVWRGTLWTVETEPPRGLPARGREGVPPALAAFVLPRGAGDFPPGAYRLRRHGDGLELALDGSPASGPGLDLAGLARPPVLVTAAGAEGEQPPAALALFDTRGVLGLPGAAVFHPPGPPGRQRWELPVGGLGGILADRLPRREAAGWSIVALDRQSLSLAAALAPRLSRVLPPGGAPRRGRLRLGLWMAPRPALAIVSRLRRTLQRVPLFERSEVKRWRDWETLLQPLARCARATVHAAAAPDAFRLRLEHCN
jgi:hypothetical protein